MGFCFFLLLFACLSFCVLKFFFLLSSPLLLFALIGVFTEEPSSCRQFILLELLGRGRLFTRLFEAHVKYPENFSMKEIQH
jgi:hypothetical protein